MNMTGKDLIKFGYKPGPSMGVALKLIPQVDKQLGARVIEDDLRAILKEPNAYKDHTHWSMLAEALIDEATSQAAYVERAEPAPFRVWGADLEAGAVDQIKNASRLPVAVAGALMPDAHQGYGLPIGGVLATENAVIPYAVGVDIACRMKLSVLDIPANDLKRLEKQLEHALQRETKFGTGQEWKKPFQHYVLDEDWTVSPVTKRVFDKARGQLGTSGSGNHFVEFGIITVGTDEQMFQRGAIDVDRAREPSDSVAGHVSTTTASNPLGLPPGQYLALLSHS